MKSMIDTSEPVASAAPWLSPSVLPACPAPGTYGYLKGRAQQICETPEALAEAISRNKMLTMRWVWTPETTNMVSPLDVPYLFDVVVARARAYYRLIPNWIAWFNIIVWSGAALLALIDGDFELVWFMVGMALLGGGLPLAIATWGKRRMRTYTPADMAAEAITMRFWYWTSKLKCPWTNTLIACIAVIFAVQCLVGLADSVARVGIVKQAVWSGELWRLLTGTLTHLSILHLGLNLAALRWLGRLVEGLTHRAYLAIVFLVAALTGSLFSLLLLPAKTSVGASGGIIGLLGFLVMLAYTQRHLLPAGVLRSLVTNVVYIAVFGILALNIVDNPAHLGGLIAGLVLGAIWIGEPASGLPLEPSGKIKIGGLVAGSIILLAAALTILLMVLK